VIADLRNRQAATRIRDSFEVDKPRIEHAVYKLRRRSTCGKLYRPILVPGKDANTTPGSCLKFFANPTTSAIGISGAQQRKACRRHGWSR
jgi:hypothetical protein